MPSRILFLILLLSVVGCSRVPNITETVEQLDSATAYVDTSKGHGTGFVVSDLYLVTCFHVERSTGAKVVLTFSDGMTSTGTVVAGHRAFDLNLIRMSQPRTSHVTFRKDFLDRGEDLIWLGHPFGFYFVAGNGIVSGYSHGDPRLGGVSTLLISGQVMPGNSGSAVADRYGRVVGIANASFVAMKWGLMPIGMATPAERIMWFLRVNKVPYEQR